jgi:hypothetical protein
VAETQNADISMDKNWYAYCRKASHFFLAGFLKYNLVQSKKCIRLESKKCLCQLHFETEKKFHMIKKVVESLIGDALWLWKM